MNPLKLLSPTGSTKILASHVNMHGCCTINGHQILCNQACVSLACQLSNGHVPTNIGPLFTKYPSRCIPPQHYYTIAVGDCYPSLVCCF